MKKSISLILALLMIAAAFVSCTTAPTESASTSSDISEYVSFLEANVEDTSKIIVGDAETALSYGVDMADFEDEGYTIRALGEDTLILGKTAAGVDRAVRDYVKHADEYGYTVTYGEGCRVEKLTISQNDISEYVILIPADADECVRFAASDFSALIEQACGVKLETVTADPGNSRVIELRPEKDDSSDLGEEGFETTVTDGRVVIRGGNVRGCMYGAYDLLEDAVGYRFLTSKFTHLYESEHVDIPEGYSNKEVPKLAYRYIYDAPVKMRYESSFYYDGDFSARRKSNNIDSTNKAKYGYAGLKNAHHGMSTYVKSVPDSSQPCLTDEWIFEECLENIMTYLDANDAVGNIGTKVKCVDLGQNDNNGFCNCKNCINMLKQYRSQSGLVADFTSRIAEEVSKKYPDILVGMYAYWGAIIPPQNIEIHPNVQLCYVIYGFCQQHSLDGTVCNPGHTFQEKLNNIVHTQYLKEWMELIDNVHIWNYSVDFWRGLNPFMNIDDYCADFRYFASLGINGIFDQYGYSKTSFDDLYIYLMSLCAWDTDISDEEFYAKAQEFMMLFYGDGWDLLYDYLIRGCNEKDRLPCGTNDPLEWYASEYDELKATFDQAIKECNTSEQAYLIERLSLHMHYQAMCGLYEEKYVNGTEEEKAEMQELSYWIRDEMVKFGIDRMGPESGTLVSTVNFNLAECPPTEWN